MDGTLSVLRALRICRMKQNGGFVTKFGETSVGNVCRQHGTASGRRLRVGACSCRT